jgi:hypothetical protein
MSHYILCKDNSDAPEMPLFQVWSSEIAGVQNDPLPRPEFEGWYRENYPSCIADLPEMMANAEQHGCSDPEVALEDLAYLEQQADGYEMTAMMR